MNTGEKLDFVITTALTAGEANLASAYLAATQIGQFLGRAISQMPIPTAYVPFASAAAINIISDTVINNFFEHIKPTEEKNYTTYTSPRAKALMDFVVRVLVGTGLFAAGVAVTGGTLLPAVASGAAMGSLVYVSNIVAKLAYETFATIPFAFFYSMCTGDKDLYKIAEKYRINHPFIRYIIPHRTEKNNDAEKIIIIN